MNWTRSQYRHRFTHFTDALIPIYNWVFRMLGGRKNEVFRQRIIELARLCGGEDVKEVHAQNNH